MKNCGIKNQNSNKIRKKVGEAVRLNTGETTAKNNIYDMGGNILGFTTDLNPNTSEIW